MDLVPRVNKQIVNFTLLQCLGWGTLFSINLFMMWLSGDAQWQRSLTILVFVITAVFCSLILRSLLKPVAQSSPLLKLSFLTVLYSFIAATVTVQSGYMLLAVLPQAFGGQEALEVNVFIIITIAWTLIFVIWSLFYIFILRQRNLKLSKDNELRLDALLTKARLNTLHSQINPHFIFNAINNIRALILEDKAKSRDMLANLSDIFRYSLELEQTSKVPLAEEMIIVSEYLELCKIQYDQRLNISINVEPECNDLFIPRMLIQMLTENAIKHGIAECIMPGDLRIEVYCQQQQMIIQVSNSGQLKAERQLQKQEQRQGIGLNNIQQRLTLLYDDKASLSLYQQQELVVAKVNILLSQAEAKS